MKTLKSILFSLLAVFVIISCSKQEEIINATYDDYLNKISELSFLSLGESHNEGLHQIYEQLIDTGIESGEEKEYVIQFLNSYGNSELDMEDFIADHEAFVFEYDSNAKFEWLLDKGVAENDIESLMTISQILNGDDLMIAIDKIRDLESTLDETTSPIVRNSLDIAKASIHYWFNNLNAWHDDIKISTYTTVSVRGNWGQSGLEWLGGTTMSMAEDDFWGGAVGSLAGPAGTVTGALWSSAASGIASLFTNPCPGGDE